MKKIFLLLLVPALIFAFSGCGKDDDGGSGRNNDTNGDGGGSGGGSSAEQKAVLFYFGGTWCPPCGSNGKVAVQNVKNEHGSKVEVISCQLSSQNATDPFANTSSSQMAQVFQVSGVPAIYIGGPDQLTSHPSNAQMSSSSAERVTTVKGLSPIVSVRPTVKLDGKTLTVTTKVGFLEDHDNEYRLAVYITESRLEHPQASDARTVDRNMHDDVLRKNLSPTSAFGELLAGNVTKGTDQEYSFFDELDDSWDINNLRAVAVVWKRMPNGFMPVNAASVQIK